MKWMIGITLGLLLGWMAFPAELHGAIMARFSGGNCATAYPDVCIAPPPPDLDCAEISHRNFRVVENPDPHRFDGDDDGIGCEQ